MLANVVFAAVWLAVSLVLFMVAVYIATLVIREWADRD